MSVDTPIGLLLKISAAIPATFDAAAYSALTWATIGEVTDGGEMGDEFSLASYVALATGHVKKYKGSRNAGSQSIQLSLDTDDAGQILAKTAQGSRANYSFQMHLPNGDKYYFQALVMSFKFTASSADSVVPATLMLERNFSGTSPVIESLAA